MFNNKNIIHNFHKGAARGPENSKLYTPFHKIIMGFHRLAINGLDENSGQPMNIEDYVLICNGEIYNHTFLEKISKLTMTTGSDCEIIIHLYKKYGIYQTLKMLDGVFAFVLLDKKKGKIFVARDCYGVRPLFEMSTVPFSLFHQK